MNSELKSRRKAYVARDNDAHEGWSDEARSGTNCICYAPQCTLKDAIN